MTAFLGPENVRQSPRIGLMLCRRLRRRHNVKPIQGEHTTYLVRRSDHCPLTWPPHWPIAAGAARTGWAVPGQQWASPGSDWSVRGWPPRGCGRRADVWAWRHAAGGLGGGGGRWPRLCTPPPPPAGRHTAWQASFFSVPVNTRLWANAVLMLGQCVCLEVPPPPPHNPRDQRPGRNCKFMNNKYLPCSARVLPENGVVVDDNGRVDWSRRGLARLTVPGESTGGGGDGRVPPGTDPSTGMSPVSLPLSLSTV